MNHPIKKGFSFGLTSGIITTLGLIVGLHSGTHSKLVIIGGVLVIAVADALSDALGIHISEESENKHSPREVWESTISTFLSKLIKQCCKQWKKVLVYFFRRISRQAKKTYERFWMGSG